MNLKRLRDFIRFEAQVAGTDTLVGYIDSVINEVLKQYTGRIQRPELLITNFAINALAADNPTFALPTNLQHFLVDRVRYSDGGTYDEASLIYSGEATITTDGFPNQFVRQGSSLTIWPQTIASTAKLYIDYYKLPDVMIAEDDEFPIPDLEETVRLEAISRVARFGRSQSSGDFKIEAQKAWSGANAVK